LTHDSADYDERRAENCPVLIHLKRARPLGQTTDLVRLEIRDAGIGFDPAMSSNGLGLTSMRERLRMVGGTLNLTSASGQGTLVEALVHEERTTGR
jgi:signal transduction histidine kinase